MVKQKRNFFGLVIAALFLLALCLSTPLRAAELSAPDTTDPYSIMRAHYQATGGLGRWKKLRSSYSTGSVIFDGLRGTFKLWERMPLQFRLDEDFGVIRQIQGDCGTNAWQLDYNNQLEVLRDAQTRKRRRIARYFANFEHLRRNSSIFTLYLEPQAVIAGVKCHVIRMENSINSDITWYYFASDTLRLLASKIRQPDIEISSRYSDHRQVAGLTIPFHQSDDISPRQKHHETQITHIEFNQPVNSDLFALPLYSSPAPPPITFPVGGDKATGNVANQVCIPFRFIAGGIYVRVRINGDSGWWVVDSGASSSLIDKDYARRLHLQQAGQIKGFGFGNNFDLTFATLPGLEVGSGQATLHMGKHIVTVYAGLSASSYEPVISGVLGYDFLSRFVVRIDYAHRQLTVYDPASFTVADVDGTWIDAPLLYRTFTVPVVVDDKYSGRWSVDLGAERSSFNVPYIQKYAELQQLAAAGVEHVSKGLASFTIDHLARFNSLEVGGLRLDNPVLSLSSAVDVGSATIGELVGNLGSDQLQNFVLWLDYPRQRVLLQPGELFNQPQQLDKSGLLVGLSAAGQPMISFVANGTPAARAGMRGGDLIVSINGKGVQQFAGVMQIRQLLCAKAGSCYNFVLQRADKTVSVKLCLENLL